jgi:hypothetical protein
METETKDVTRSLTWDFNYLAGGKGLTVAIKADGVDVARLAWELDKVLRKAKLDVPTTVTP